MRRKGVLFLLVVVALITAGSVLFISAQKILGEKPGCFCANFAEATGAFDINETQAFFNGKTISALSAALLEISSEDQRVLGKQTGDKKWIEIDLSEQKLRAWQGNELFLETLISTGKWAKTPTGEFRIWSKFKYAKMSGGSKELRTYYYLPNVPYTMYFYNGFGLHGTYWHNNFGQTMSHGCVNMPTPMAEKVFYWSSPVMASNQNSARATSGNLGTKVVVHE